MSGEPEKILVKIKYKDIEQQLCAPPQEAWLLLNQFFKNVLPSYEIAQKLMLKIDTEQLAKDLNGIVAFSNDGVSLLSPKNKMTDNDALLVWLAGYHLGHELGLVNSDSLSKEQLQDKFGKTSKITSTRIGELSKSELITKNSDGGYKITTFGIVHLQKETLPKFSAKASA